MSSIWSSINLTVTVTLLSLFPVFLLQQASLVAQLVKNPPAKWETWVQPLGWEEGNGYPLQDSGQENSMDCIVHRVAKSQTWLSDFHVHVHGLQNHMGPEVQKSTLAGKDSVKFLGVILPKEGGNLCSKKYDIDKGIEEDTKRWEDILCSWIWRINTVN